MSVEETSEGAQDSLQLAEIFIIIIVVVVVIM
jgi:hypothetical protein